jgi:hypothetical protein
MPDRLGNDTRAGGCVMDIVMLEQRRFDRRSLAQEQ